MITIKLHSGETAVVVDGVWTVSENEALAEVLNSPTMQPPVNGHYAPSPDARMAEFVLKVWGGEWLSSDEHAEPGKLY